MFDACKGSFHVIGLHRDHEDIGVVHLLGVSDHADRDREVHQACNGRPVFLQVRGALTTSDQRHVFPARAKWAPNTVPKAPAPRMTIFMATYSFGDEQRWHVPSASKRIRPTDIHDSPYTFRKIRSFPYWLITVLQCREKLLPSPFQVLPDGMHYLIEGIIRSGINIQVQVV